LKCKLKKIVLLGECVPSEYPLSKSKLPLEFLRTVQHLRPRTNTFGAMARIRSACAFATHEFFTKHGFFYVHTPLITASDCEGAGEMFQVTTLIPKDNKVTGIPTSKDGKIEYEKDFFKKPAYLTVSGQLNGEMYACALSNIYTFGPTFRAENSHTTRHASEFWMIEPEMCFCDLNDTMDIAEAYVKHVVNYVLANNLEDINFFETLFEKGLKERLENVAKSAFKRVDYTEAIEILLKVKDQKFENKVEWGIDLNSEHERYLTDKYFKQPIFIINYPQEIKSFYMRKNPDNPKTPRSTVAAMDMLVPKIGELVGGSQREERLSVLEELMKAKKLDLEAYKSYLDLRRFGSVMHSGFGLGFERLIMFVTGIENIRDAIPFPRVPGMAEN